MLVIRDEQLSKELAQIAAREKRPVEDVLKSMLAHYPTESPPHKSVIEQSEAVKRIRRKVYAKARKYWASVGDSRKAALTDEELDEQFGVFDAEGIPRLKDEMSSQEPPPGSLAYAAMVAARGNFSSGRPDLARRSDEILDEDFTATKADKMSDENANNENSR